jgi:hypothetical protein
MAAANYITKAAVTLVPGAFTLDATTGVRVGTGGNASGANLYGSSGGAVPGGGGGGSGPQGNVVPAGSLVYVDPASAFGVALGGAGNLTAVTRGQETGGVYGTAN